ncbi:MAG: nucleotide sugar dehydrogenase [SAR324 cluster bacterium]|nr:nucleotide sugar dehydrogenase [SAR324 cluster bacterium]
MMNRKVCILGVGFKGMVLAMTFGQKQTTWGFDTNSTRITEIKEGLDRYHQFSESEIEDCHLIVTDQVHEVKHCDFYIIHVPAGLKSGNQPDLSILKKACADVGKMLTEGDIVIIEPTLYPGVTEEICLPILEETSGLIAEIDFGIGYSPERMGITDPLHDLTSIPKLVACNNEEHLKIIADVYETIVPAGVIASTNIKVTEAAKLFENIQKDVNLGLVNEFAMILDKIEIDSLEVLDLAYSNKNVTPFKPGLVGGHHITVSPYYLSYLSEKLGQHPQLFAEGRRLNDAMPGFIAKKALQLTSHLGRGIYGEVATILGLSYKKNIGDMRGSRVIDLAQELEDFGMDLQLIDPLTEAKDVFTHFGKSSVEMTQIQPASLVILSVDHDEFQDLGDDFWVQILEKKSAIVDLTGTLDLEIFTKLGHLTWRF